MPTTEDDSLGPPLERQLRRELNRVRPPYASPRYLSEAHPRVRMWRFAPVALGVSLASILALSVSLATGSANPVVWTQRVVTVIESNPAPTPEASPVQPKAAPLAGQTQMPKRDAPATSQAPAHSETPDSGQTPEPSESPEPSDGHSGSGSSSPPEH